MTLELLFVFVGQRDVERGTQSGTSESPGHGPM